MNDTLLEICTEKRSHVSRQKSRRPLHEVEEAAKRAPAPRGFHAALERRARTGRYGLITEIKKASPSKGLIRSDFDPPALAAAYERGGATCISVLTDGPYFMGEDQHLVDTRVVTSLPVLRKDFIIDPYQVAEARMLGADCILLIIAAIDDKLAKELDAAAGEWKLDVLVEVHDQDELERAMYLDSPLLGINNRNLRTLTTSLDVTRKLAPRAVESGRLVVSESGLFTPEDLKEMHDCGARAFLVGESLMRQDDVEAATRRLAGGRGHAVAAE